MAHHLIERAQKEQTPIIDGEQVTFLWEGKKPPVITGDFSDWEEDQTLSFLEVEPKLWATSISLPKDAYIEYAFLKKGKHIPDPYNLRSVPNGFGSTNHYFYMPNALISPLTRLRREFPAGTISKFRVPTDDLLSGTKRRVTLYNPPVAGPYPLLLVLDGQDYQKRGRLTRIVDNLIGLRKMQPVGIAMVDSVSCTRTAEYACSEATMAFLVDMVLPLARKELNVLQSQDSPANYGILGASMGGLMALFTALRAPHLFGKVLSQSGAFSHIVAEPVIFDLVNCYKGENKPSVWMDVGRMETLLSGNQRMRDLLEVKGFLAGYREYSGGHNYTSWRNDIWYGLEALFPPRSSTE